MRSKAEEEERERKHLDCVLMLCSCRLTSLLNYQASQLMGKSLFDYHHGEDSEHLSAAFKCCK